MISLQVIYGYSVSVRMCILKIFTGSSEQNSQSLHSYTHISIAISTDMFIIVILFDTFEEVVAKVLIFVLIKFGR